MFQESVAARQLWLGRMLFSPDRNFLNAAELLLHLRVYAEEHLFQNEHHEMSFRMTIRTYGVLARTYINHTIALMPRNDFI